MSEEERKFLEMITSVRKEFKEIQATFSKRWPPLMKEFIEECAKISPVEEFKKIAEESRRQTAETKKEIMKNWRKCGAAMLGLIGNQFEESSNKEEIERRGLIIIELLKEIFLATIEELNFANLIDAELEKHTKK